MSTDTAHPGAHLPLLDGRPPLWLDGASLSAHVVAAVARTVGPTDLHLDRAALVAVERAARLGADLSTRRAVYGRTTGVGANRDELVPEQGEHGLRLLRSHSGGTGDPLDPELVRAALLIRLNQLLAGRSGVSPALVRALADAVAAGARPVVHRLGAIGTGDLAPLAQIALALAGEGAWDTPAPVSPPARVEVGAGDALAFVSSNAVTLAEAALAAGTLDVVLASSHAVAALSYLALDGSPEAYADPVHRARPHPGQVRCAQRMRHLLGMERTPPRGRRIQDPFGLRAFPQVNGPAIDALATLHGVLDVEINAGAENPMIAVAEDDAYHHAHFHTAYVAGALDHVRACVHGVAELSAARLGDLVEPEQTGLRAFLADGPPGSSGVMILEYMSHDALAALRQAALPVTLGSAVVSRGLEDHASFSTQAARATTEVATAYTRVLACELVAAVRALRLRREAGAVTASAANGGPVPVEEALARAEEVLDPRTGDRPLAADVDVAAELLRDPTWAQV
ncbi:aromatic amino acid ammonia-lyase [Actinomycetospora aeridis]|uniref:Aromatic amino acid ammonia-lyase n=1 Tax=Actinomycetospora aeridis TaxID=3129231 RepID=A0ABU8NAA2_9PSEU